MVFFVGGSASCAAGKEDGLVPKKVALHQPVLLSDVGSLGKEIKSKNIPVNLYPKSLEINEKIVLISLNSINSRGGAM